MMNKKFPLRKFEPKTPSTRPFEARKPASKNIDTKKTVRTNALSKDETSWGGVADWYDKHLVKSGDTYHEKVVYPNLLRLLGDIKGKHVLDLACGQGQFSTLLAEAGVAGIGVDIGKELIAIAEKNNKDH